MSDYAFEMFGFTNDKSYLDAANKYRESAIADGWNCKPTYGDHEPMESAASLEKDGFKMSVLARTNKQPSKYLYSCRVSIWGPDGLAISPPDTYDWIEIVHGQRYCKHCGKSDVDTQRYSFAGRACADCIPALRAEHEKPGWCN